LKRAADELEKAMAPAKKLKPSAKPKAKPA